MSPDLAFWFRCAPRATAELDAQIEQFLIGHGYGVLNLASIRGRLSSDAHPVDITAIDANHRIVLVTGFQPLPNQYSVGLYSPPPTRHDAVFETELLSFAAEALGSKTEQVARYDNSSSVNDLHERDVRRIEGLFREAKRIAPTAPNKTLERMRER
jgi:hypothetical protein